MSREDKRNYIVVVTCSNHIYVMFRLYLFINKVTNCFQCIFNTSLANVHFYNVPGGRNITRVHMSKPETFSDSVQLL